MHVPSSWPAAAAAVVVVASIPPTPTTPVVMKPAFLLALARRSFRRHGAEEETDDVQHSPDELRDGTQSERRPLGHNPAITNVRHLPAT